MENCSTVETPSSETSVRSVAPVKWFNSKAGYGFLSVNDNQCGCTDVFVHHSGILVNNEQYKYLVQGEYVEYRLEKTEGGKHEYQAVDISGINKGKLMCETRREFKQTRSTYQETTQSVSNVQQQQHKQPKKKLQSTDSVEKSVVAPVWSIVKKKSDVNKSQKESRV